MRKQLRLSRLYVAALAIFLGLFVLPGSVRGDSVTLGQLLEGHLALVVGDKVFFNFRDYVSAAMGGARTAMSE